MNFAAAAATAAVSALLRGYDLTWRTERVHGERWDRLRDSGDPFIFALWHGRMLVPIWEHRGQRVATMASKSKDGEIIARWLAGHGYLPVRGSTNKGGARGVVRLARYLADGHAAALTVDGPKGPPRIVQEGIVTLARRANAWILPISCGATRPRFLKSWDRYLVPKAFSRNFVVYGEPFRIAAGEPEAAACARIKSGIDAATVEADGMARVDPPLPW
ncbi:MAG TPA: lysophospholipid acyltransferase family protein [Thermoanaerobaculia bacterium]|nr:lysophospholipid acyltransferase family protein [Thermoanaerobaculia bacterium]